MLSMLEPVIALPPECEMNNVDIYVIKLTRRQIRNALRGIFDAVSATDELQAGCKRNGPDLATRPACSGNG
ncbi:hypothetical protein QEZ47_03960 [Aminobacter anthyllidis]|uniref:hypothetical protein n=1 Tax=Aminobacter anthyllidis TaxID=1035067 RepID=UPI00245680B9|nr:hypothetical protein [Aminobacter anthyllidis]MDH4984719.1 hypothetical protein [Aminobacter anthyllidis]